MARGRAMIRQWTLLLRLQHSRTGASVPELHRYLLDEGERCVERTVRRDLNALAQAGFDLAEDEGRWRLEGEAGGFAVPLTVAQLVALLLAEEEPTGSPLDALLHDVRGKVRAMLSPRTREWIERLRERVQATPHAPVVLGESAHFDVLVDAINARRVTRIRYWSPSSGETERDVEPYLLWRARGGVYVVAYDHRAEEERTFALQRIRGIELLDATFEPSPAFDAQEFTRKGFGVFHGPERRVVIEFHRDIAYLVRERRWHHTQRLRDTEWGVEATWHMAGLLEIARWVAGFGGHARVHEPRDLARMVRELHEQGLAGS